jgi:hypothetical protein
MGNLETYDVCHPLPVIHRKKQRFNMRRPDYLPVRKSISGCPLYGVTDLYIAMLNRASINVAHS